VTVTINNPGPQLSLAASTVYLQMVASGGTITYTETDLPPGLTIGSSSGIISGYPTTQGNWVVTITATVGASHASTTFYWAINLPVMFYQGNGGIGDVDDEPLLVAALNSWYAATGIYPSLIVFSGTVCL
jgi:hypothetical protein